MIPRIFAPAVLIALALLSSSGTPPATPAAATAWPTGALRCLIVGGGPNRRNNPIALENNITYVHSLLPADSQVRVLYADADLTSPIVRVETTLSSGAPWVTYRRSQLTHVDGPATLSSFDETLGAMSDHSNAPLLLYFTGHGAPDPNGGYVDNAYELWGGSQLVVSDLSQALAGVPRSTPVTLVMVQCFSGAFASVFFDGSDDDHPRVRPDSCGFFASIPSREAAGCTPDINQADYRDFTTYFFGALAGRDRLGRPVRSPDYDHDGVVEMDEAFAYTLGHDRSIDTPMATSDAYVRRFTTTPDREVFHTPYAEIVSWASPAQRDALATLSDQLKLTGDDRAERAYEEANDEVRNGDENATEEEAEETARWIRFARLCKTVVLEHQILTEGPADVSAGLREILDAEHAPLLPPAAATGQVSAAPDAIAAPRALRGYDPACGCSL